MAFGTTVARATGVLDIDTTGWDRGLKDAEGNLKKSGSRMAGIAKGAGLAIGAGIGLAAVGIKKSVDAAAEAQKVNAQVAAVLKSTGGAAKVTAKEIDALASSMAKKTVFDDDAIKKGQSLLLTFTNIRNEAGKGNDIFNQTTRIMADMATALGTDAGGSAIQLGKALNDPIKGITALTRVGVSFTEGQKETIKRLVESGNTMGAQKIILRELNREFGGSAEAAGKTFAGQLQIAKNALGEVQESIGNALLPVLTKMAKAFVDDVLPALRDAYGWLKDKLGPVFSAIGDAVGGVVEAIKSNWGTLVETVRGPIEAIVQNVTTRLKYIWEQVKIIWEAITTVIRDNWDRIVGIVRPIVEALVSIIQTRLRFLWELVKTIWEGIARVIRDHSEQLKTIGNGIMGVFKAIGVVLKALAVVFEFVFMKILLPVAKVVFGKILPALIGALISIIAGLVKAVTRTKDFCVAAFNAIKTGITTAINAVKTVLNGFRDAMTRAANWVRDKAGNIVEWIKGIPGKLGNIGETIWNKLKGGWEAVGKFVRGKIDDLVGWFQKIPSRLGDFGGGLASAITGPFKTAWNAVANFINRIPDIKIPIPFADDITFGIPNLPTFARGGRVRGRRRGRGDSVLGMLTPGEAVLNEGQIARMGGPDALRRAGVPGFAQGGQVVLPGTSHNYPARKVLGDRQIADLVYRYGWKTRHGQTEAVMVVLGESSGNWGASNVTSRESSWGGWQINRKAHPSVSVARATDPEGSSTYARGLFTGAKGWQPWGAWTDGRARRFADRAKNAVDWHRTALKRSQQTGSGPSSGGGGGSSGGGRPGGRPPPVSVEVAPETGGPIVGADPEWPGTEQNYRRLYGTYYQDEQNRYINFQPNAALWWRPGYTSPGPLLNVPETIEDEPGTAVGPLGGVAVDHAFSFPKWQRWWGLGTHKAFTQMAQNRGMSPKALRDWATGNILAAAMIGFTRENLPPGGDRWPWQPKKDEDKDGKGGGKDGGKGGSSPSGGSGVNAARWRHYVDAYQEARRIHGLPLSYVYGGSHTGSVPSAGGPFDCSSYVSRVLMGGGIIRPRASYVSGDFLPRAGAGMAGGKGQWLTVWTLPGSGKGGHVLLQWRNGRMSEAGGYGGGGNFFSSRPLSGFVASHPPGYAAGGLVGGMGPEDSIPALLSPGEVVLTRGQQARLGGLMGSRPRDVFDRIGVPRRRGRGLVKASTGAQLHFHWFGQAWTRNSRSGFENALKAHGIGNATKWINEHPVIKDFFAGKRGEGGAIHGMTVGGDGGGAQGAPVGGGAPPAEWDGDGGLPPEPPAPPEPEPEPEAPAGPSAAEIEAQIQERLRRESEAIWGARLGFLRELAPNIFTQGPQGLELGSSALQAKSTPVVMNNVFNAIPDDPFTWLRQTETAARFAMA